MTNANEELKKKLEEMPEYKPEPEEQEEENTDLKKPEDSPDTEKEKKPEAEKKDKPEKEKTDPDKPEKEVKEERKKEFWEDDADPVIDEKDYKMLFENAQEQIREAAGKLSKFEENVLAKYIVDLETPEQVEEFLESWRGKSFDTISTEELFKMQVKADSDVQYSERELDKLWIKEQKKIKDGLTDPDDDEEFALEEKDLRKRLLKDLKPKVKLNEENEYVKGIKQTLADKNKKSADQVAENKKLAKEVTDYADSLVGQKVADVEITSKDIERAKKRLFSNDEYKVKDKEGKERLNTKQMVNDMIFMIKAKEILPVLLKDREKEVKKKIANPSADSRGANVPQDKRGENEKAVDGVLKDSPLKKQKVVDY